MPHSEVEMSGIPVAQYLRMSSEAQEYSLQNQEAAIGEFAKSHGFCIVKNYSDPARSGLTLAKRQGLRELLADVTSGHNAYRSVLVYDVSRWGRFQDVDESAHYEFLCKCAGVTVHYCAEPFGNNGGLADELMKALKRCMAAQFSRELGVHVYEAKRRIIGRGFNVGGRTPFGLRRKIVSDDPARCRILEAGERKYDRSERLTLVPGPPDEVHCVREIFRGVLERGMTVREIARDLNTRNITLRKARWTQKMVWSILTNPVYIGISVWGRSSQRLGTRRLATTKDQWTTRTSAFPAIVQPADFEKAQQLARLEVGRVFWTPERLRKAAEQVLKGKGTLSYAALEGASGAPKTGSVRRFGLSELCRQVGYELPERFLTASIGIKTAFRLHSELTNALSGRFPGDLTLSSDPWPRLILDGHVLVSLILCRYVKQIKSDRWRINPVLRDMDNITLLCRLNRENTDAHSFFVLPRISFPKSRQFGEETPWFKASRRVDDLAQLCVYLRMVVHDRDDAYCWPACIAANRVRCVAGTEPDAESSTTTLGPLGR